MKKRLISALFALCALASSTYGALTLNIDTNTETFWFTGSDSGTITFPAFDDLTKSSWGAYSSMTGLFPGAPNVLSVTGAKTSLHSYQFSTNGAGFSLQFAVSEYSDSETPVEITLSGGGAGYVQSYGSLSASNKAAIDAWVDGNLSLSCSRGTGFSDLTVVDASSVPEPSTYALMTGLFVLGGTAFRRRLRK